MNPKGQRPSPRLLLVAWTVSLSTTVATTSRADDPPVPPDHARMMARGLELFKSGVRESLVKNCLDCHGGKATKGEFDLSTREALLREGPEGLNVVPGKSAETRLYRLAA